MVPALWESRDEHYRIYDNCTIKSHELLPHILKALETREPLSIVRMSDGEDELLLWCKEHPGQSLQPSALFPAAWQDRLGLRFISCDEIVRRLALAAATATYFAPDGERNHLREHFPLRDTLVEIYFPYRMPIADKRSMFEAAQHVLVVNGYQQYVDAISNGAPQGTRVSHISIRNWRETDKVVASAWENNAPLVLVSAGPAGKYIIPEIAKGGKVVLDVGDGMGSWWIANGVRSDGKKMNTNGVWE